MTSLAPELARRQSNRNRLITLFRSRPLEWISWVMLGEFAGNLAWRTRVSDARKALRVSGRVEWNRSTTDSRYRYVPYIPLGPSAETPRERRLF